MAFQSVIDDSVDQLCHTEMLSCQFYRFLIILLSVTVVSLANNKCADQ